jgi:hypothetical protein
MLPIGKKKDGKKCDEYPVSSIQCYTFRAMQWRRDVFGKRKKHTLFW